MPKNLTTLLALRCGGVLVATLMAFTLASCGASSQVQTQSVSQNQVQTSEQGQSPSAAETQSPAGEQAQSQSAGGNQCASEQAQPADSSAAGCYKTFSVIGDSYSTFSGCTTVPDAPQFYPASAASGNDVAEAGQMWWSIFARSYGAALVENNSWSGRPVCHDGWAAGDDDAHTYSFTTACESIGDPELVLIFGGTNDSWIGVSLGDYRYEGWSEGDLRTFRGALSYVFDKVGTDHPSARVVFLLNSDLSEDVDESARTICAHYGVGILELKDVSKACDHPDRAGMQAIADQLVAYLEDA